MITERELFKAYLDLLFLVNAKITETETFTEKLKSVSEEIYKRKGFLPTYN